MRKSNKTVPEYDALVINPGIITKKEITNESGGPKHLVKYSFYCLEENKTSPVSDKYIQSENLGVEIIINREVVNEFENYLFYCTWQKLFTKKNLNAEEIKIVRQGIESLGVGKEAAYLSLQTKVKYHNQRDNKPRFDLKKGSVTRTADAMCNLTSLAMAFETLGVSKNDFLNNAENDGIKIPEDVKNGDFEDLLDFIRNKKKLSKRTNSSSWDKLAIYAGVSSTTKSVYSSHKNKQPLEYIKERLKAGDGVVLSIAYCRGHIVRMQNIDDKGVTIDDPFGEVLSLAKREFRLKSYADQKNNYRGNSRNMTSSGKKGEDNQISWDEIDVSVEKGCGGVEEVEVDFKIKKVSFNAWLKSQYEIKVQDYPTREESFEKPDPNNKGKTITETKKYYITKGATVKYYKIYSK